MKVGEQRCSSGTIGTVRQRTGWKPGARFAEKSVDLKTILDLINDRNALRSNAKERQVYFWSS